MKRMLASLVVGYVVIALVTKAREAAGLLSCDCCPDCWCRRPGLSLFRWVFPRFHHGSSRAPGSDGPVADPRSTPVSLIARTMLER
jgi:hypothetical protein